MWNRTSLICAVWLALLGAAPAGAWAESALLSRVTGTPMVYEIGDGGARHVSSVAAGQRYRLPLEIETGPEDAASFILPTSTIDVAPSTVMRIVAPEREHGGVLQRVLQSRGSSLFSVNKGTLDEFRVETPYLVSVVKGTVFNVVVHDGGATVSLHEGRLWVNSIDGGQHLVLEPGDVAFAGRDGEIKSFDVEVTRVVPARAEEGSVDDRTGDETDTRAATGLARVSGTERLADVDAARTVAVVETAPELLDAASLVGSMRFAGDVGVADMAVIEDALPAAPIAIADVGITDVVDDVVESPIVEDLVDPVAETVEVAGAGVADVVDDVIESPIVEDLVDPVAETVEVAGAGVTEVVDEVIESPIVEDLVDPVAETVGDTVGAVAGVTDDLVDAPLVDDLVTPVAEGVGDLVQEPVASTTEVIDDLVSSEVVETVTEPVADVIDDVVETPVVEEVTQTAGDLVAATDPLVEDLTDPVTEVVETVDDSAVGEIVDPLVDDVTGTVAAVPVVGDVVGGLGDVVEGTSLGETVDSLLGGLL